MSSKLVLMLSTVQSIMLASQVRNNGRKIDAKKKRKVEIDLAKFA